MNKCKLCEKEGSIKWLGFDVCTERNYSPAYKLVEQNKKNEAQHKTNASS